MEIVLRVRVGPGVPDRRDKSRGRAGRSILEPGHTLADSPALRRPLGRQRLAGLEMALDPGFKTYWRNPGESGLPPRLDWSASDNVAGVTILWPAPTRVEDGGGVAYVYSHEIVLPVLVTPRIPSRPVRLALSVDYGICREICIPVHAEVARDLDGDDARAILEESLAKVPKAQALGSSFPPRNPLRNPRGRRQGHLFGRDQSPGRPAAVALRRGAGQLVRLDVDSRRRQPFHAHDRRDDPRAGPRARSA